MKPINKKKIIVGSAGIIAVVIVLLCVLMRFRVSAIQTIEDPLQQESAQNKDEEWEIAQNTPLGRYPETITYTLGKVTAKNNSNMPNGDTYEDNNYTRYVLRLLNVQNQDVMEGQDHNQYYCVVARKGFEHPEIIPKVLSALFDYARYDGKEEAEGVGEYLGRNVDPTATPFVINIDYSDAIFRTTNHIQEVLSGEKTFQDLTVLEQGYYKSCREYLDQTRPNE